LYSIPARDEWVQNIEKIPGTEYARYFDRFNPTGYDPKEWAKTAREAGMKYAVLTAKHHEGFCLFDSKLTEFKSTNTACGRDLVREFLEAFRSEGIRVGLYYSLLDWHHPDYPHAGDRIHPERDLADPAAESGRVWERYLEYMHGQVEELVTGYGKLDILWFDFSYDELRGEKWGASKLVEMARKHQPGVVIDNRLDASGHERGSIMTANPAPYAGDFTSPEQMVPPEGYISELGEPVPWEACVTLNKHWGYHAGDSHYKDAKLVIRTLVECVSKNGNMILNVGPDAKGRIPEKSKEILREVGDWLKFNGDSVYGCGKADYPKPEWGRFTQKGGKLYAHVFEPSVSAICLPNLGGKVSYMRRVADDVEIERTKFWTLSGHDEHCFFFPQPGRNDSYPLPDERDTVIEVLLKS
jgi:alpha-L-fucosidase